MFVHRAKPCHGWDAHAGAVDVLAQAVAANVFLVAVEVGIGECGTCRLLFRSRDADAGGGRRVAVGFAVGVVGGGLDEGAVRADDGDVAAEVVGDVVVGHEVGVEVAAGKAQHLQRVCHGIACAAAKHVAIAAVRTHGRAARASGKRASGDGCHGRLVGRIQVVAESVPPQKLPVAAFEAVLHRMAIGIPMHIYYLRRRHMQLIIDYLSA